VRAIAQLSDPHFGRVDADVQRALLCDLKRARLDLVLLTGDITQRARRAEYRAARAFIEALPAVPWLALPGNHDIPLFDLFTRCTAPYRLYRRFVCAELEPCYADETFALRCVNAVRAARHKHGSLSVQQIERIAAQLRASRRPFELIATHHPLAVPRSEDLRNLARGAQTALRAWTDAGADLFLGGHIHLPYCGAVRPQGSARSAVLLQAGTAISTRVRRGAPHSYNRIVLRGSGEARRMRLEQRDYDAAARRFRTARAYRAERCDMGWRLRELWLPGASPPAR
jgi:3',5'-cyclic AMP phosphodiesterase CpdA